MVRLFYQSLAWAAVAQVAGTFAADVDIEELFEPYMSRGTEIAESTDADFADVVSPRWSEWEPPTWTGAIKPQTEHDLQNIVSRLSNKIVRFH